MTAASDRAGQGSVVLGRTEQGNVVSGRTVLDKGRMGRTEQCHWSDSLPSCPPVLWLQETL